LNGLSITVSAVSLALTVGAGTVRAESRSCEQGRACELGAKPETSFTPGKVDGAAVWQSDGYANVWFTTTTRTTETYKVAVCSAASVEEVKFEGAGSGKDTKLASPKGKLSGCDVYSLQTGRRVDGLRIKPQGKSFKLFVLKNDEAAGYSLYIEHAVLPAREGHYQFRLNSQT